MATEFPLKRYDVIARKGGVAGRFSLPLNERVIGVGAHALYVARTDAVGLQHIERHSWP